MGRALSLRPRRADDFGLRGALSDRALSLLVTAISFLAALALGGVVAAASLALHWRRIDDAMTVLLLPNPTAPSGDVRREDAVLSVLHATPGIRDVRHGSESEFRDILRPWIDGDQPVTGLSLPALFDMRVSGDIDRKALEARLIQAAPGTILERASEWPARLHAMILSLQTCALFALLLVACTASTVVGIATRAGIAARRGAIEIVYGLGATDGFIAGRFAGRVGTLVLLGSAAGAFLAVPVLLTLSEIAAPFTQPTIAPDHITAATPIAPLPALPALLWIALAGLPVAAWIIAWITAQVSVRLWLARLT